MCELLPILSACDDGCPNTHYSKVVHETDDCGETDVPRKGHSLLCLGHDDHLGTAVWPLLKDYLLKQDASAADDMHFMCNYCKPLIRRGKMPARCVLKGLHVVEVPPEFSRLDCLSKQFIQLAKAYQTVVQLGTYTAKVPTYNSLKACKGSMLFLCLWTKLYKLLKR